MMTSSNLWFHPDAEPGDWSAKTATERLQHPCRHCRRRIDEKQQYLFERPRPWLVIHFDCILSLGRDAVRAQARFDRGLCENDDEMTKELWTDWLALTTFIEALDAYRQEIESRRSSLELFIQGHRPALETRLRPRPRRPPRRQRRG